MGGGTPEDMIGNTDHDYSRHDLADQYVAEDRRVIQTGNWCRFRSANSTGGSSISSS